MEKSNAYQEIAPPRNGPDAFTNLSSDGIDFKNL
jgi:hypothetical protein